MAREASMSARQKWDSIRKSIELAKRKEDDLTKQIKELSVYDDFIKADTLSAHIKIALPGVFHKYDVSDTLKNLEWFGLYKQHGQYHIKKTEITIEPAFWGYIETTEREAKKITAKDIETPILLIAGIKNAQEGFVESVVTEKASLSLGQKTTLTFNEAKVHLYAFGTISHKLSLKEYFLKMSTAKKISGQRAGDIDRDGMLDLILELDCSDAGGYQLELFL